MAARHFIRFGEPRMRVELDKKALFALASDSRLEILKSMQPMRRTVTQLAETLGIDKAAVHRHLKTLEEGGFVKRYEEHGFVYYGLSWKSRDLLSPGENTKVVILLTSSVLMLGLVATLTLAILMLEDPAHMMLPPKWQEPYEGVPELGMIDQLMQEPVLFWTVFAASASAMCASMYGFLRKTRRPKQPGAAPEPQGRQ
ncbi:MAG: winged helix-turn-helix domain-containing protein [Candidatus Thermoplasmatota archaeon]